MTERQRFEKWCSAGNWKPSESMWAAWEARSALSEIEPSKDTVRLDWLLRKVDPVELDAVLGRSASQGTSICTADEARSAIDAKIKEDPYG